MISMKYKFKVILSIKVIILFVFSSEYSSLLFHPFVNSFIDNGLKNPWQFYFEHNLNLDSFPYHPLMLFILCPFAALSSLLHFETLFKLPLLFADLGILYVLLKSFPNKEKSVYLFYFLNPIIIYAIYIHSQLDIIPTAILLYAIYLLMVNKFNYSSLVFGLALATKIHIIIALPLIFFYLYKIKNIRVALKYIAVALTIFLLFDLPFLFSDGFIQMVLLNPKQSLLFDSFYNIGSVNILLPIAAILMIYLHFFNQEKVNHDLLYFYFGILFTATIFFIYSGSAWYVWMIPFVSMYFIQNNNKKSRLLYISFSVVYLVFFIFFYKSEYRDILFLGNKINIKIHNERLADISFTLLEVTLVAIMYAFYKYGIKSNSIYKKQLNLIIGIGGDSGVGKTTLLNNLQNLLGDKLLQIEGDGEHKWERGDENWNKFTHLDPKANHIHKQSEAIFSLKHNETIFRSEYEHSDGKFSKPKKVKPKEFIVIAGLHPFYLPKLRKNIDFKIYIDTDETLRRHWKIIRDTKKRGYSTQRILEQIETRMEDAGKYIYPQKEFADMIIKYYPVNRFNLGEEKEKVILGLKITFDANIHIEDILNKLNCPLTWDYNDDLKSQYIEIENRPHVNFEGIALNSIENIKEIIASDIKWESGYEGLIQLISLKMISEKLKENNK
ncbi:uridine kinase [Flavobacterium gawalongense]|uniref:phosphoribulokinase n=1 Tax=Flavobacterium gawalongense TaxID=2594432 RepID=A0A553BYT3_9FLAO|nr:uridine kinase [Flavobacterium gawalongense]TRX13399.1 uridine kinase [Flavobacterium gawalongense]TRX15671.1 uridine kinase [Flavobacterium gawalongense]TRX31509.1 uridine kinase [Flavobacterium gawalongense]